MDNADQQESSGQGNPPEPSGITDVERALAVGRKRTCASCKYHLYDEGKLINTCMHPEVAGVDLVTGRVLGRNCSTERYGNMTKDYQLCGLSGWRWEPKK